MYRLLADIFNDAAMILDCLSPAFPRPGRVLVLSFSSTLRALCGVCAGSAKASLSAHFATKGNLGELNAVSDPCCSIVLTVWNRSPTFRRIAFHVWRHGLIRGHGYPCSNGLICGSASASDMRIIADPISRKTQAKRL